MKNILVRIPSYSPGNVGDLALVRTMKKYYAGNLILPNSEKDLYSVNLNKIDFLVYFGNDCLAYYSISTKIIEKFLSENKMVHVVNTSWGKDPKKENLNFLKTVSNNKYFQIYMRDEYSHELIKKDLSFYNDPILTADLAFLCPKNDESKIDELENWVNADKKPIIGINIHEDFKEFNKLIEQSIRKFIKKKKKTYRFLFIPHDSRKNEYDFLKKLSSSCGDIESYVCTYLEPEYEKNITEKLFLVITGRMHLSILTIPNEIPAIVVAYNGAKAKGSLKHWNLNDLVIETQNVKNLNEVFDKVCSNYQNYIERIKNSKYCVERRVLNQIL